ncbi:MAG: hypothetical protein HON76_03510 [Candidatus Scalindua sp.]|nr:hypothetical protein [Candidatus Scalindua sp.]MBT6561576.1 hypothetical protein [Candidatus Scalindua sp.]
MPNRQLLLSLPDVLNKVLVLIAIKEITIRKPGMQEDNKAIKLFND